MQCFKVLFRDHILHLVHLKVAYPVVQISQPKDNTVEMKKKEKNICLYVFYLHLEEHFFMAIAHELYHSVTASNQWGEQRLKLLWGMDECIVFFLEEQVAQSR